MRKRRFFTKNNRRRPTSHAKTEFFTKNNRRRPTSHAKKEFFTKNNRRRPASQFSFPFPFSFWPGPGQDILLQKYQISSKNIHFLPKIIVMLIIKNGRFRSEKKDEGALCLESGGRIKSYSIFQPPLSP